MSEQNDNAFDDELMALAAKLPTDVAPDRDLWPDVEQAISLPVKPSRTVWNSVWAQAAAVLMLVAGSSGITYFAVKDDTPVGPVIVTEYQLFETVSGDFGEGYTLGVEYQNARGQLEGSLVDKLNSLSPTARADVVKNLNTIRVAIKDINEALAKEPDNVLLQELLLNTYHEEMSLMRKVDGLGNSAMRRDDI